MMMLVASTDMSGTVVGGTAEEVEARVLFFFRSASGSGTKLSGKLCPLIHYPVFIHNKGESMED
jgi:hypothetical protein